MRKRPLTVEDLMTTALVTAKADELVDDIDFEMKLADIRHIPIVDDHNHLVGIVSQRDLLRTMARSSKRPVEIKNVMTRKVWTVPPDAPATEAAEILLAHKVGSVPVVRDDGQLVGIITETDFLDLVLELMGGESVRRPGRRAS